MVNNKDLNPLTKLTNEARQIFTRLQNKLDWNQIDKHQSLTFLDKNYHRKPSDIAKLLFILIGIAVFIIEGLRTVTILMCYVLPVGIMLVKICESMKTKKHRTHQQKSKLKDSELQEKSSLQKNDSLLSINSKPNDKPNESQKQKSQLVQQEGKVQNINISLSKQSEVLKNDSQISESRSFLFNDQQLTINQLYKIFILYFIINLILDLTEPLLLLIIQIVFSFGQTLVNSLWVTFTEGNFWALLWIPFQFLGNSIVHMISLSEVNSAAKISFIALRIVVSAFLLNMNKQQSDVCLKLLETNFIEILLKSSKNNKPKTQ